MQVLVTGATGFVGGRLVRRLREAGHPVRALVRPGSDAQRREALSRYGVELCEAELKEQSSLWCALEGVEAVVHCAGHVQDWGRRQPYYDANVLGTRALAKAARGRVGKLVHLSTTDVYGYPHRSQVGEDHPQRPCNYYNETKIEGERIVTALEDMEVTVLRPASIYGPGSYSIVVEFLQQVKSGFFPFFRSRAVIAGLTYVDNLCEAIELALQQSVAGTRVFNLTDGSAVTWENLVDALAQRAGVEPRKVVLPYGLGYGAGVIMEHSNRLLRGKQRPLLTRMAVQLLGNHQDFSIARAQDQLGYRPRQDFAQGMEETAAWLSSIGLI